MEQLEEDKCENCTLPFNAIGKAMWMLPCGHQICITCIEKLHQPQESKLTCPICQEIIQINDRIKQNLAKLRAKGANLNIYCKDHPEALAEHFCKEHYTLICIKCAFSNHSDHRNKVVDVKRQHSDSLLDYALEQLTKMKNSIITICERIGLYKSNEKGFFSDEFLDIVKDIQGLVIPHLNTQQERDQLKFMNVQNLQIQQDLIDQLQFDAQAQSTFNISIEDQKLFQQWIGNKCKFELFYRGSRDTFKQTVFADKCYNKGSLLVIIKSEHQKVYGCYTSVSIPSNNQTAKDQNLFIFSLTHKTKHSPYNKDLEHVRSYNDNCFFAIGASDCLWVRDDCNTNAGNGGRFYENDFTPNLQMNEKQGCEYLTGSDSVNNFTILEVEAYKIAAQP